MMVVLTFIFFSVFLFYPFRQKSHGQRSPANSFFFRSLSLSRCVPTSSISKESISGISARYGDVWNYGPFLLFFAILNDFDHVRRLLDVPFHSHQLTSSRGTNFNQHSS